MNVTDLKRFAKNILMKKQFRSYEKKLAKKMCGFLFFYNFAPEIIKEEKKRRNRKKRCHLTTCNIIHQQHVSRTGFVEVRFHL